MTINVMMMMMMMMTTATTTTMMMMMMIIRQCVLSSETKTICISRFPIHANKALLN
jgi:hypothetical protein